LESPESTPGITHIKELFTYHIFGLPRELGQWQDDIGSYSLAVTGLVDTPVQLSLAQIRRDFEPIAADMVLQCMTNIHWGRVHFTGARLLDVLDYVGVSDEAWKIALRGADGFDTDLTIDEVRSAPHAYLLAYAMNDEPVTPDHGFPIRLTADGKYGYKWCKWLTEIELVDYDFKGHYEGKRQWSDLAMRGEPVQ